MDTEEGYRPDVAISRANRAHSSVASRHLP